MDKLISLESLSKNGKTAWKRKKEFKLIPRILVWLAESWITGKALQEKYNLLMQTKTDKKCKS